MICISTDSHDQDQFSMKKRAAGKYDRTVEPGQVAMEQPRKYGSIIFSERTRNHREGSEEFRLSQFIRTEYTGGRERLIKRIRFRASRSLPFITLVVVRLYSLIEKPAAAAGFSWSSRLEIRIRQFGSISEPTLRWFASIQIPIDGRNRDAPHFFLMTNFILSSFNC